MNERYTIIGTAGHIDHGKTTLIKALTGRDTDSLEEEKRRGISINLGFTYFDLPNGDRVGIIDAPGHEKFIKNMMSGVVGIDLVLMIIAADDGVMPQTLEHADILTYMGVENFIIVITKCDTVEEEMIDLVEEDIKSSFKDTPLFDAKIVRVDSVSKKGFNELINLIQEKSQKIEKEKTFEMPARLNVDRSFNLKGLGTVVTGTLIEGEIEKDKSYMLYPSKKEIKIRSIEVHGVKKEKAIKGQRTAINIPNLNKDEIERGDIIASPGSLMESEIIDAKIKLSKHHETVLKHWSRVRVFLGAKEILARVVPLENKEIKSGEESLVQLRLEEKIFCKQNDRFVLRSYSPVNTIGGGIILEINSKKHNLKDAEYLEELEKKENYDIEDMILKYIKTSDLGSEYSEIYSYIGRTKNQISEILEKFLKEEKIFKINETFFSKEFLENLKEKSKQVLKTFHKKNALEIGMNKEELREKVQKSIDSKDFSEILNTEIFKNDFEIQKNIISLKSFSVNLSNENQKIAEEILKKIECEKPLLLKIDDFKSDSKIISYLLKEKLKLLDGFLIDKKYYEELKENLIQFVKENGGITIGEFRDLSKMSRKMALSVLDDFDKNKITKRIEDKRILY